MISSKMRTLVTIGFASACYLNMISSPSPAAQPRESFQQRAADGNQPGQAGSTGAGVHNRAGTLDAALLAFLEGLLDAVRAKDPVRVSAAIDTDRMFAEIERQEIVSTLGPAEKTALRVALRIVVGKGLLQEAVAGGWQNFRMHRQHETAATPLVIDVHALNGDRRIVGLVQLWLARDAGGSWKLFDWQEASSIFRSSTMVAMTVSAFVRDPNSLKWQRLVAASRLASRGDMPAAERVVLELANTPLPAALEGPRWLLYAQIKFNQGQPDQSLECLDQAIKYDPRMIGVPKIKALIHAQLKNPARSLEYAQQALAILGHDAEIYAMIGNALVQLDRKEEAAAAYRKGLDDDPNLVSNLAGLAEVLPADKRDEVVKRLARASRPAELFSLLANALLSAGNVAMLEFLLHSPAKPAIDQGVAAYYDARVAATHSKWDDAAKYLESAVAHADSDGSKRFYCDELLDLALISGRSVEAYQQSEDPRHAFDRLARQLSEAGNGDTLLALARAHLKRTPKSADGYFYEGRALTLKEQFDEAAQAFADGAKLVKSAKDRESFRSGEVFALYKAGKGLAAYRGVGPERATLEQLLVLCHGDRQSQLLIDLANSRRKDHPTDPRPDEWEAEGRMNQKDFDGAAEVLKTAIGRARTPARKHSLIARFLDANLARKTPVRGYAESTDPAYAFGYLVPILVERNQADDLAALVRAYRGVAPDELSLGLWEAESEWIGKRYDQVVDVLARDRAAILTYPEYASHFDDRMVRSLVRLKRFAEAAAAAKESTKRDGDPWFEAVVAVASCDVDQSSKLLPQCVSRGYTLKEIESDQDMGPALKTAAFTELLQKLSANR